MSNKKVYINPPPSDLKCYRCRRHLSELEEFGGAGDPLVGDFSGQKLVKTFRSDIEEIDEEMEMVITEINRLCKEEGEWNGKVEKELEGMFGEELLGEAIFYDQLKSSVSASWECRDCIIK